MELHKTENGSIDLIFVNNELRMQFNGPCLEMLPYCNALCCRLRPGYSIDLEPEETGKFEQDEETGWLKGTPTGDCVYLANSLCTVHNAKPHACQIWHCSPGGTGLVRAQGWRLDPVMEYVK